LKLKTLFVKNLLRILILLTIVSCKKSTHEIVIPAASSSNLELKYAQGFTVTKNSNHSIIDIKSPWPEAEKSFKYVLISAEEAAKTTFMRDDYDGMIITPIKNIVVTSTTHIPALELLDVEQSLAGFPGCDYISSKKTRSRIAEGKIRELGKNEGINTEVLLELRPDVVIAFGVDGTNKSFETIKKARIPVIYNGDWVESSPLAKAEWIKFFGALFNKEDEANAVFKTIEQDYLEAKKLASTLKSDATVLSGAMYKDVWYLPNGTSPEAQLLKDANANYLWKDTTGKGSLSLSFEAVFNKAQHADIWLSPSYYKSLEDLENANTHYTKFDAFKNKQVFSFTNAVGETGGLLYYELGTARPDLVLKDIINICHPGAFKIMIPHFLNLLNKLRP